MMADGGNQGMQLDIRQLAASLKIAKRSAERRAVKEGWKFVDEQVRGGRRRLYSLGHLPSDVQTAVLIKREPPASEASHHAPSRTWTRDQVESAWQVYNRRPDHQKATAQRRQRALLAVESLVETKGMGLLQARSLVATQLQREDVRGASAPSLARWAAIVDGAPRDAWTALLVPEYLGRTSTAEMPEQAWDMFKGDWLRVEAPTAKSCYARLERKAAAEGWTLPSLRTFERRIDREIPIQVQTLARQGDEALMRMFPAQERDRSGFHAMQALNADGHKFDVFVRFGNGEIGRPIMVGVQDLSSGKLLGYRLAETESADLARLAFMDTFRRYGIPESILLDNGRAFASKQLTGGIANRFRFKVKAEDPTGILVGMGIKIYWATPYHGQAKPIERAWRDLCDRVAKHPAFAGAYTGNNPMAKPENYRSRAIGIEEFQRVLAEEITAHNARTGRTAKICAGRSFDQVFNASYATAPIRKATDEQLRQMLLATDVVQASRQDGSVRLGGNRYWCEALASHAGQRVQLRFDPDNLHVDVDVYTMAGVYVGQAGCIAAVGFADTSAATEHARAKKQHRNAAKKMLHAERRMDASQVAQQLPAPPPEYLPSPTVISPKFGGRARKPEAVAEPMRRTGTDNAVVSRESSLDDHLQQMQERELASRGWKPSEED